MKMTFFTSLQGERLDTTAQADVLSLITPFLFQLLKYLFFLKKTNWAYLGIVWSKQTAIFQKKMAIPSLNTTDTSSVVDLINQDN